MPEARVDETFKFKAEVSGTTFTQAKPRGLELLVIEDHVDMIGVARFTVNLDNGNWSSFELGADVSVMVGSSDRVMFKGLVTGLRHTKRRGRECLVIIAMDPLCRAAASRRTLVYEEMTDSAIASQVMSEAQLEAGKVDATETTSPYVLQRNESDLEFLKRLAARNNYLLMCSEGRVNFMKPQFDGEGVEVCNASVETLDYSMNAFQIPPSITAYGWDYVATSAVEGTASSGDILAIGGGQNAIEAASKIWSDTSYISDVQVATQEGALAIAASELNRAARNFLRGTARLLGNADIYAGAKLKFTGFSTGFNPEVYVISARHTFETKRGYTTEVQFCGNTIPT